GAYFCSFIFMTLFTVVIMVILVLRLNPDDMSVFIQKIGISIFPILYFGWLLSHGVLLRNIGFDGNLLEFSNKELGLQSPGFFFLVIVFACTFVNDTGAFFVGRKFGEHKLSPAISPGKTIEGTIGGLFFSIVAAFLFNMLFSSPLTWEWCIIYGLVIGVSAVFGDLVESALKRGAGVKDSGGIVPGHGGILDRFDSFFFVFPAAYYLTVLFYYLKGISFY
ncbi:MAG: phosphatidate cytidylyltransferase, partial [Thermodesulfobacteriota bacterium]